MSNIKINDVFQRIQYTATNAQTQFAIPFPFFSNAYVYVWQDGVQIIQGGGAGQYGITGAGSPSGGQITLVTPATTGDIITIEGIMPIDRTSIYSATISNLTGSDLNGDFNREVVMMKQIETTQALLQLQYAPWVVISQNQTVTKDRYIPLLPALGAWRMNAGATAIETFLTPDAPGLAPSDATYILQVADSNLPNAQSMGALGSGLVVSTTGTGAQLTRTLTGTSNQITLTFGSGIGGDPVIAIAANPILPGVEYFKPPQGTTAQRPGSPSNGMVRYNTDLSALEVYESSAWDTLSGGLVDTITGTANQISIDNTDPANPIILLADNPVIPGVAGITIPSGTTAQRGGGAGSMRFNSQTSEFEGTTDGVAWNTFQTSAGTVLSVLGTAGRITSSGGANPVIDIDAAYVGQASITTLGTVTTGVWEGTDVGILYGGTGVSSVTTAPAAIAFAGWDASLNMSANNFLGGFATTVSAAGTTTLTVASAYNQEITGVTTQTIQMPVAATLTEGHPFRIMNNSSGNVTLNSSGGNAILVMAANTTAFITCILASGTTAASWNASYVFDNGAGVLSITGTANQVIASASTGAITLSLPQSIATTSDVTFGSLTFSSTSGIIGTTTNDSAAALSVGEYVTSSVTGSPVAILNNTATNLTSISLTAGDWDVWGHMYFQTAGTTVLTAANGWISSTSATLPATGSTLSRIDNGATGISNIGSGGVAQGMSVAAQRFSLSATTTIYISGFSSFTTSTNAMVGFISARRRR